MRGKNMKKKSKGYNKNATPKKVKENPKFVKLRHFDYSMVHKIVYNNGKTIEEIEEIQNNK